jgi:Rps23 Pro-64 3,4-dihydroxylase Tpa1-like proline 4-hydroxylase
MKIDVLENFFSEDLYNELITTAKDLLKRHDHNFATNAWWDHSIVKDSFPVLIHSIYKTSELYKKCREEIENKINYAVNDHNVMIYYWTRFSYIPWHDDNKHAGALTVYLNEHWEPDFGGYFLYGDVHNNDIRAILPARNLGVLQEGGTKHATTPVNYSGGMRISVQVFLDKK